jgi:predicted metal-dependent peptidase
MSGSMLAPALNQIGSEVQDIIHHIRPEAVDVIYWDTEVQRHDEYTPDGAPVDLRTTGGGGTDINCLFEWIDKHAVEPPLCLICATDMGFWEPLPATPPPYPVLWLTPAYYRDTPPWGQVLAVTED